MKCCYHAVPYYDCGICLKFKKNINARKDVKQALFSLGFCFGMTVVDFIKKDGLNVKL